MEEDLKQALLALMREITVQAPYDPNEAYESWESARITLHEAGEHSLCDHP